jgi:AAA+ ATPase superfamily predicted ATPase
MMQGLVLDRTAPLFGRADEIIKISPLPVGWIRRALRLRDPNQAIEAYSVWGGVPRYWELAAEYPDLESAIRHLILSPLGILHDEPASVLMDDMRDTTQASSIMSLIGQGCHRISEIATRLEKPATSLSRPLKRLTELGLVDRRTPFGVPHRRTRRTLYQIADPFLRFWFRFIEPNRSRLEGRQISTVMDEVKRDMPHHIGAIWEELARKSVPFLGLGERSWKPANKWWGANLYREMMEIDVVAESTDGGTVLIGEVKWSIEDNANRLAEELRRKAESAPFVKGRKAILALWLKQHSRIQRGVKVVTPRQVLETLR